MSLEDIEKLIVEYFELKKGEHISDYLDIIEINYDFRLTRRALKHITEQRVRDGYSREVIFSLFENIEILITENRYKIIKNAKETNGYLLIQTESETSVGLIIAFEYRDNQKEIKTAFYKPMNKIKKILTKNKNL